jgi:hypothetical protein
MPKKVLCAVSHGLYEPWISILKEGQEKTWLNSTWPQGFELIHFHGTPLNKFGVFLDRLHEKIRWSGRRKASLLKVLDFIIIYPFMLYKAKYSESKLLFTKDFALHIHFPDSYLTYRWKELGLFSYFLEKTDADYLFITSTSSYVNVAKFMEYLNKLPESSVYAGGTPYENAEFISGSNRILSRDLVKRVNDNSFRFNPFIIEDVALGKLVGELGVQRITFPLRNISTIEDLDNLSYNDLLSNYHFRLKSGPLKARDDVKIMLKLHKLLQRDEEENDG